MEEKMAENSVEDVIDKLMKGMNGFLSTKTVVGEPLRYGDVMLIPLVDVSFGVGAGAGAKEKKANASGGMGGKITPSAILVLNGDNIRLVNIKNQDSMTKILDMVPDIVNKFTVPKAGSSDISDEEAVNFVREHGVSEKKYPEEDET